MKIKQTLLTLFLLPVLAMGQSTICRNPGSVRFEHDSVGKWDYHINLGMGVTSGFGATNSYMLVAPTVEYKANEKWAFKAGFAALNGTDMAYFMNQTQPVRDLAPRRHTNSSLALGAMVSAQYQVNDRLWVAGTLWRVAGQTITPGGWGWWGVVPAGIPIDLNATGVTGELHYDLGKGNSLGVYISYVNDRTGAFMPLMYDSFYGYGLGGPMMGYGCPAYGAYNPFWMR